MAVSTSTIAELGALVGDPGRANMLMAMLDGRALTARELADHAGVTPQTASGHLAKLLAAGMIRMERQGRHRYHRLASADIAQMLEAMHVAGAQIAARTRTLRTGPRDAQMREARSCYDHLAGRVAVDLADVLTDGKDTTGLSPAGERRLVEWGVDMAALHNVRRPFCRPCLDWSERRPHLAGAIGAAILDQGLASGWLRRLEGGRALQVTPAGQRGFHDRFGLLFPA